MLPTRPSDALRLLAMSLPPVLVLLMGWARRWTCDDAFIVFRVSKNLVAGEGPVFNAGERVEAATTPLWMLLLAGLDAVTAQIEWSAVLLGLAMSVAAVALALRLHQDEPETVPLGMLVFAVLPPAWEFATSGLETGLSFLGIASTAVLLARRRDRWAAFVAGLLPLVRPDLGLYLLGALALVLHRSWRTERRLRALFSTLSVALAAPLAWQVFRMGYYAALTPTTAIAKEAAGADWAQGLAYLADMVGPYALFVPLSLLGVVACASGFGPAARTERVWLGATGLVHAVYVIRVGGDFMHARLLLPPLFAMLAAAPPKSSAGKRMPAPKSQDCATSEAVFGPSLAGGQATRPKMWRSEAILDAGAAWRPTIWAAGVRLTGSTGRRLSGALAGGLLVLWAVACAVGLRVDRGRELQDGIADERGWYTAEARHEHPITLADHAEATAVQLGYAVRTSAAGQGPLNCPGGLVLWGGVDGAVRPTCHPLRAGSVAPSIVMAVSADSTGRFALAAGPNVHVIDRFGLSDPLAARMAEDTTRRIGHRKRLPDRWIVARFAERDGRLSDREVDAARAGLEAEPLRSLVAAVTEPLGGERFWDNLWLSFTLQRLRIPR